MEEFIKKYVDREMASRLIVSGIKPYLIHNYRYGQSIPKPHILYKICFVIAVEKQLDLDQVLWEAIQTITGV